MARSAQRSTAYALRRLHGLKRPPTAMMSLQSKERGCTALSAKWHVYQRVAETVASRFAAFRSGSLLFVLCQRGGQGATGRGFVCGLPASGLLHALVPA